MFAFEDLTLERDLSDIEAVTKEVGERTPRERDAANSLACPERANLGDDAWLAQIRHQRVEAAKPQVAGKDDPDLFGLGLIDGYLAIPGTSGQIGCYEQRI